MRWWVPDGDRSESMTKYWHVMREISLHSGPWILALLHDDTNSQMAKGAHIGSGDHTTLKRRKTEDDDSSSSQSKKPRTRVRYVLLFCTNKFTPTPSQFLVWRMPSPQAKGSTHFLYPRGCAHTIFPVRSSDSLLSCTIFCKLVVWQRY